MKKLLALLLALCMVFAFAACGASEEEKELDKAIENLEDAKDSSDVDEVVDAMDDLADKAESAGATTDMSAKDIVDSLLSDESFKSQLDAVKDQGLTCTLEARGNSIAYVYKYTIDIGDITLAKQALDTGKASLESLADSLCKVYTGIDSVIFEYRTNDNSVIATYEF